MMIDESNGTVTFDNLKDVQTDKPPVESFIGEFDDDPVEMQTTGPAAEPMPVAESGAQREKLTAIRYDYMPSLEVNESYARVAEFGAHKYDVDNWMKGLPTSQIMGSLMRHCWAWMRGEEFDDGPKGSGLRHTDHILWNAVALVYNVEHNPECDDRFPNRLDAK